MPPRTTAVIRAVSGNGPILPFLYPAASRRLLSTGSAGDNADDQLNQTFGGIFNQLRKSNPQSTLPDLPPEDPAAPATGASGTSFATLQQTKRAFNDMGAIIRASQMVTKLQELADQRRQLENSLEKVDIEIFRYSPPIMERMAVSPGDLTYEAYLKTGFAKKKHLRADIFEVLSEDPMTFYKNFNLLKDFMTTAGRIKHRSITGLTNTNQRKVSKAIRRAIGIGLMPSVYRHPSVLAQEQRQSQEGYKPPGVMEKGRFPKRESFASRFGSH